MGQSSGMTKSGDPQMKLNSQEEGLSIIQKNTEVCNSWVIVPGTAILPTGLLAIAYCFSLIYLFMGIGIISDIFMSGIERITAEKKKVEIRDANDQVIAVK